MLKLAVVRGGAGALSRSCRGFRAATAGTSQTHQPHDRHHVLCRRPSHAACDEHTVLGRGRWAVACRSYSGSLPLGGGAGQNYHGSGSGDSSSSSANGSSSSSGGSSNGWYDQQAAGSRAGADGPDPSMRWPSDDSSAHGTSTSGSNEAANHARTEAQDQASTSGLYKQDFSRIMQLALPLMVQNLFGYLLSVVCTVSIGRIGPPELAASSLANSVYVVTGLSLVMGLSSAMETLCGQAYGARNYRALGEVLQRALLVCWAACIPVALLWCRSAEVMVAVGQDPAIAAMAGRYLALCIPCLFLGITNDCLKKYLQAQGIVKPSMYATAASTLLAPAFFWALVHQGGWGLDGAAVAFIMCQVTTLLGILGFVVWHVRRTANSPTSTWGGFSAAAATSRWGQYLRYGIPAMVMVSLDWWVYECAVLMTGWLPQAQSALAVGGIAMMIISWMYMVPMGLGSAVNTCVSNALGSGRGARASRVAAAGITCALAVQATLATGLSLGGRNLITLITSDPGVAALAAQTLPVLSVLVFFDGINAVLSGVLRGSGEQAVGAAISSVYLACALPLCYSLTFLAPTLFTGLPIIGGVTEPVARVWMGVALGSACQAAVQLTLISRWDWEAKARRAAGLPGGGKADA